jgi:lysophospholipase L1-like esterase
MRRLVHAALTAVLLGAAFAAPPRARADEGFLLKKGDRVVFFGDSITEQRLYTRGIEQYVYCRYPDLDVRFFNAGWGGDTVPGARNRLARDVLELKPTVVTLFFGMNDGAYQKKNDLTVNAYRANLTELVKDLKKAGVRVVVFGPGCCDGVRNPKLAECNYDEMLEALSKAASEVAKAEGCTFGDVFHPLRDFVAARHKADNSTALIPDGVHPDAEAGLVIANAMLHTLGAEPMPPLGTIDADSGRGKGLKLEMKSDEEIVMTTTGVVPMTFWFDPAHLRTMRESGFLDDLAGQKLTVTGLARGTWDVEVDDGVAGTFSSADLAKGVLLPAAALKNGRGAQDFIVKKDDSYFNAWRNIRLGMTDVKGADKLYAATLGIDDAMHQIIREQVTEPRTYLVRLSPAPAGENLALHRKYESSDPNQSNFGIGGLTDGSWESDAQHCFATGASDKFPKTVTIDLEAPSKLATVRLGVPEFGSTRHVKVSTSLEGRDFTDAGTVEFEQKRRERRTLNFTPVKARFVRLTFTDRWPDAVAFPATFGFATECEVYAAK